MNRSPALGLVVLFCASCSPEDVAPRSSFDVDATPGGDAWGGGGGDAGAPPSSGASSGAWGGDAGPGVPALPSCGAQTVVAERWLAFDSDRDPYNRDIYLVRGDGTQFVRLTTEPSTEREPAISHDGKSLVFTSDRGGSMQLYSMDLATRAVKQLTSLSGGAGQASWAGDDTEIVFHSGAGVYLVAPDGSNLRMVASAPVNFGVSSAYTYPSLTADGAQILLAHQSEIDVMNVDGTGLRSVVPMATTTMETPALSPDGSNVAFAVINPEVSQTDAELLAIAPFAGSTNLRQVPDSSAPSVQIVTPASIGSARRPAWVSADLIAFERGASSPVANAFISLVTLSSQTACDLVGGPGDNRNPSWAPAGFQPPGWAIGDTDAGADASDAGAEPEAGPSGSDGGSACPLPADVSSRWLAFDTAFAYEADGAPKSRNLYLVRADGSGLTALTSGSPTSFEPAFSNSGRLLAFASDRSGSMQIHVMDLTTHAETKLTALPAGADQPSWSKDDTQIAFRSGPSVYLMGSDGSNPHIVVDGHLLGGSVPPAAMNWYEYPALSGDGAQVVFDGTRGLDAQNVDGTGFRQLTGVGGETAAVSPNGVNVAFAVELSGFSELIAVAPFAGTADGFTLRTVTPDSAGSARRPAWGSDSVIAFEHGSFSNVNPHAPAAIAISTAPGAVPCDIVSAPGDHRNPSWAPAGFQPQ